MIVESLDAGLVVGVELQGKRTKKAQLLEHFILVQQRLRTQP
jgi:hypothetical protein